MLDKENGLFLDERDLPGYLTNEPDLPSIFKNIKIPVMSTTKIQVYPKCKCDQHAETLGRDCEHAQHIGDRVLCDRPKTTVIEVSTEEKKLIEKYYKTIDKAPDVALNEHAEDHKKSLLRECKYLERKKLINNPMFLPLSIDLTPEGEFVERAEIGEPGYHENIEYELHLTGSRDKMAITYYGEDDTYLDDEQMIEVIKKFNPLISSELCWL